MFPFTNRIALCVGLLLLFMNAAQAAPVSVYEMAGAPSDPQVIARWNYFRNYSEATGLLKQLAAAHPEICTLQSVGKSYDGRDLWVMTLTDSKNEPAGQSAKPGFWIDGGIHANEIQSVDVVLYTAWFICESHGRNSEVDRLLKERVIYLMPMMSPDSRDAHMNEANTTHSPRTGQMPIDDDRDGFTDEDPPEDLDGDGSITSMYVLDPHGKLKRHPRYPNALVPIDTDDKDYSHQERYTYVGMEGYDNDGDGRVNEDGDGVYDPNRDWAWQWQPAYVQRGALRHPFSVPSNRQVAEFIMAHPNIGGAQSYHNTGGMILRGPGAKDDRWPREDIRVYDALAKRGEEILPGYKYLNTATGLYEVWGGEHDWLYAMGGAFAFTNELNTPYNLFHKPPPKGQWIGPEIQRHKFSEQVLQSTGFAPLKEVDHPQFGKVLVGGQTKNWGRQPPSFMLEEECHRNMAFTLFHADQCPLVEIDSVKVEPYTDGFKQVTATLINRRLCPTRSRHDLNHGITPPDEVTLTGAKAIAAMTDDRLLFDQPKIAVTEKEAPNKIRLDRLASKRPKYVRWIIADEGDKPVTISIRSVKGGVATLDSK